MAISEQFESMLEENKKVALGNKQILADLEARLDSFEATAKRPGAGVTRSQDTGHVKAFVASMRTGRDSGLAEFQNSMSTGSDPDGGYAVPSELERSVTVLALNACPMEQEC